MSHEPPADDEVARLRVPPNSKEAEQSVLGAILLDNEAWDRVADMLLEGDFYRHEHRLIFTAIGILVNSCQPADVITVFERLQRSGHADEVGGLVYLNALAESVPSGANARRYASIVREKALLRRLVAISDEVATDAFRQADDPEQLVEKATQMLADIQQRNMRNEPLPLADLLVRRIDHYTALNAGEVQAGWATGIEKLDVLFNGGLRAGHLTILAARPKVGKTSFAMEIVVRFAEATGLPVLALTQEMSAEELTDRLVSRMGSINGGHLQTGQLSDKEWSRLAAAAEQASTRMDVHIDDQPALTLSAIRSKARRVFGRSGRRGGLLVLDYLQLTAGSASKGKRERNRNEEIEEVSRGVKNLSKQLGISVLALSQLNREVDKQPGRRPHMGNLRDCGAIEADADQIVFLWKIRDDRGGACRIVGVDVNANRHGPAGEFAMEFWPDYQRWEPSEASTQDLPPSKAAKDFE